MQQDLFPQQPAHDKRPTPAPAHLPFRLEFRTVTGAELEWVNRKNGFKGARAYLPTTTATSMARSAKSMVRARLQAILEHPDERVPVALMSNSLALKWTTASRFGADSKYLRDALYQRGIQDAEAEGFIWTPFLDALAEEGVWPRVNYEGVIYSFAETGRPNRPLVSPDAQADKLIPWIREQRDRSLLRSLLGFQYRRIAEIVAQYATCLDDSLIDELLARSATLGRCLAANPSLTEAQANRIIRWAVKTLADRPAARRFMTHYGSGLPGTLADTLLELHEHGWNLDTAVRLELLKIAQSIPTGVRTARPEDQYNRAATEAVTNVLLGLGPLLEPDLLLQTYEICKNDSRIVSEIVAHPAATLEIKRHIARDTSLLPVRTRLAEQSDSRKDPRIRRELARSSSPSVLVLLCRDADSTELRRLFRKLARRDPEQALNLLMEDDFDSTRLHLADVTLLLQPDPSNYSKRQRRERSANEARLRRRFLLWLRRKPLADDSPGHEGETAEEYARPLLEPLVRDAFRSDEPVALELMRNHAQTIRDLVTTEAVAGLLESPNQEVRLAAMMFLTELRGGRERDEPRTAPHLSN